MHKARPPSSEATFISMKEDNYSFFSLCFDSSHQHLSDTVKKIVFSWHFNKLQSACQRCGRSVQNPNRVRNASAARNRWNAAY